MQQATFIRTSKGYLNLGLVRLIKENKEAGTTHFVFDDTRGAYLELPFNEGCGILGTMAQEMLIFAE
jgi:hypothetical protein